MCLLYFLLREKTYFMLIDYWYPHYFLDVILDVITTYLMIDFILVTRFRHLNNCKYASYGSFGVPWVWVADRMPSSLLSLVISVNQIKLWTSSEATGTVFDHTRCYKYFFIRTLLYCHDHKNWEYMDLVRITCLPHLNPLHITYCMLVYVGI